MSVLNVLNSRIFGKTVIIIFGKSGNLVDRYLIVEIDLYIIGNILIVILLPH